MLNNMATFYYCSGFWERMAKTHLTLAVLVSFKFLFSFITRVLLPEVTKTEFERKETYQKVKILDLTPNSKHKS